MAETQNFVLGMKAKTYFSTTLLDGVANTPDALTWNELGNLKDLTLNLSTGEADVTTRANNGWRATAATLKEGEVTFQMVWKPGDAAFEAIRDAWLNSTEIAIAAMDGDISVAGNQGLVSNFTVTNFSRSEPLEEALTVDVTIKPSSHTDWYVVATGV